MQTDLFTPEKSPGEVIELTNGEYRYWPNFYDRTAADLLLKKFSENIHWKQEEMNMYGKIIKFPRLTAWYGENDKKYSFSGITLQPEPWNAELREVKNDIETVCGKIFNSVLLNLYRDGV